MDVQVPTFSRAILHVKGLTPIEVRGTTRIVDTINQGQPCNLTLTKSTQYLKRGFREHLIPIIHQRASRCTSDKNTITYYFNEPLETPFHEVEASQEIEKKVPFFSKATMLIEGGTAAELQGSARLLTAIDQGQNCSLTLFKSGKDNKPAFRGFLIPLVQKASRCTSNQKTMTYFFDRKKTESGKDKGPGKISNPPGGKLAGRLSGPVKSGGRVDNQPSGGPLPPATTNKSSGQQEVLDTLSVEKVIECTKVCEFPGCNRAFPSADSHRNCTRHSECLQATPDKNQAIFSPHDCQDCSDMLDILNEGDSRSLLLDVARYLLVGRLKMARQAYPEVLFLTQQFGEWMKDLEKWYDGETVEGDQPPTFPGPKRRVTGLNLPRQPSPPPMERFTPVLPAPALRGPPSPPRRTPPPPRYTPPPPRHLPMSSRFSPPPTGRLSPLRYSSPPRRSPPRQRRYSPPPPRRSSPSRYSSQPRHSQLTRGHSPPPGHSQLTRGHSPPPRHSQLTRGRSPIPSSSRPNPTPSLVANLPEKLQHLLPDLDELPPELLQLLTNESSVSSRLGGRMEQPSAAPDSYEDRYASRSQREHGDRYQDRGYPRGRSPSPQPPPQPPPQPRARPGADYWDDSYKQATVRVHASRRSRSDSPALPSSPPSFKRSRRDPETTTEKLTQKEKDKLLQLVLEDGAGIDVAKLKSLLQSEKSADSPRDGVNGGGHVKQGYSSEGSAHHSRPPPAPYSSSVPPPTTGYTSSANVPGSAYAPGSGSSYAPGSGSLYAAPPSSGSAYPPGLGYATQPMYAPGSTYAPSSQYGSGQAPGSLYTPGPAYPPNPAYPPPGSAYPPPPAAYGSYH